MNHHVTHVDRLLGVPELAGFVTALVRRIERGHPLSGMLALGTVEPGQRAAIAALFGRRPGTGTSISVDLDQLDLIIRSSGAAVSLSAALEQLRGPLIVKSQQAGAERRAWDAAYAALDPVVVNRPEYAAWAQEIRSRGMVKRLARTPEAADLVLGRVAAVLTALPGDGSALPEFAARVLGSAHALDVGTSEATLVLSALNKGG
ncbi:MAG: TIGR02679 domain-containing protein, partial [Lacisediminihabitans sp.]